MGRLKLAGLLLLLVAALATATASAQVVDFSTDPDLAAAWTQFDYYNPLGATASTTTAAWDSTNQNLELTSNLGAETADRYRALYKTGATRSDTDGITVTFSDYVGSWDNPTGHNTGVGLIVSSLEQGTILANVPQYEFLMSQESGGYHYVVIKNGLAAVLASTPIVAELPSTIKLDILRDGDDYVFNANGEEIWRDSSITDPMPYYCLTWAVSGANTLSVSADDFGVVPEPMTISLIALGGLTLLRRRGR
ncbi:MAG: PEP-CTERM sorting domain-containing protein [Phycisphaerae bacterium]|nr:PEP-CTERM sorting domain-containing protein [Phycisphaerae bacterium]